MNLFDLYMRFDQPLLPILESWRVEGLNVDVRKALYYKRVLEARLEKGETLITNMLGPFFSWNSPKQVAELFYEKWGLPTQYNIDKKTKKRSVTVDDDAREALRKWVRSTDARREKYKQADTLFTLLDFVHENKKLAEYFDRISPDGRIHVYWKDHGSTTFRLASKPNIQNWPTWPIMKDLDSPRSIVIPDDPEDIFLSYDYEQFELWAYAKYFNMKNLLECYERGDYIHGVTYEKVFGEGSFFTPGKPKVKKFKLPSVTDERILRAKAIPLGFQYGRSGRSVGDEHGWAAGEGDRYQAEWFKTNPELPAAHNAIRYEMVQKGMVRPPPGFIVHTPNPSLEGYAAYGQTPTACILKESIILADREFKRRAYKNTRMKLCVHDSLLINVPARHAEEVHEEVMVPILTRAIDFLGGFHFRVGTKIGQMWDWGMLDYDEWKLRGSGGPSHPTPPGEDVPERTPIVQEGFGVDTELPGGA